MNSPMESPEQSQRLKATFMRSLLTDVASAMGRRASDDSQPTRREIVRTLFTAIEGLVWLFRENTIEIAKVSDVLTSAEENAFSEKTYIVSDVGKIVEQPRFVPLLSMIRLTVRLAERISPELQIKFDSAGWNQLRKALKVRNRVTHPKSESDLLIDKKDISTCLAAFDWLFETCLTAMATTTAKLRSDAAELRNILESLKRGDPDTIADYQAAAASDHDDESI